LELVEENRVIFLLVLSDVNTLILILLTNLPVVYQYRDENSKTDDYYYGNARTSVAKVLMNNGTLDVAIKPGEGKSKKKSMAENAMFITIECQKL